ncbi:hypothetical protein [Algoriphagus sp.]|uniref:hypothetical protein n=1 Tax=Algoriphagus sp. TaxID=1872435 RepID=UPI00262BD6E5|nr:hypothetical protein [Algoriphagus sp.]
MKCSQLMAWLTLFCMVACQPQKEELSTLQKLSFPGTNPAALPSLYSNDSSLFLSWVSNPNDTISELYFSTIDHEIWTEPQLITKGSDWFVNWADFPAITENQGNLLIHHLQKSSPATFSYDVKINVLPSNETLWKTNLPLHGDSTLTEHGFVSGIPFSDSTFLVTWLDGRNTGGGGHGQEAHAGAMSIRAAEVDFQGIVHWDELLDAKTCDCCQTTAAMTAQGPVVLYRNRSDREIRDIAITRLVKGKWSEPKIIHADGWEIAGCPVNGPKVAGNGELLVVAWFTAADSKPMVKLAFSTNSGKDFSEALVISDSNPLGRVDVELIDDQSALVSWMEMEEDSAFLVAQKVDLSGKAYQIHQIAAMDPSRKSGFPQMEILGDRVYFAWTEVKNNTPQLALADQSLTSF